MVGQAPVPPSGANHFGINMIPTGLELEQAMRLKIRKYPKVGKASRFSEFGRGAAQSTRTRSRGHSCAGNARSATRGAVAQSLAAADDFPPAIRPSVLDVYLSPRGREYARGCADRSGVRAGAA